MQQSNPVEGSSRPKPDGRGRAEPHGSIILLEYGATWKPRALKLISEPIVIQEGPAEPEESLLNRLQRHCQQAAASGVEIRTAALVCAEGSNGPRLISRAWLVCRLLTQLASSAGARLVLVTAELQGPTVNGLLALGGALIERWVDAGVTVEVRYGVSLGGNAEVDPGAAPSLPKRRTAQEPGLARCEGRRMPRQGERAFEHGLP